MNLIPDLKKLICSFLKLEEILNLLDDNAILCNMIIKQYFFDIPDKGICKYHDSSTRELCPLWKYPEYHHTSRSTDPKINYCYMFAPLSILWLEYPRVPCITNEFNLGHIETVKYLQSKGFCINRRYIDWKKIMDNSWNLKSLKMLYENKSIGNPPIYVVNYTIISGNIDILEYLRTERRMPPPPNSIELAIIHGQFDTLKFILNTHSYFIPSVQNMEDSVKHKNLEITKFLHQNYGLPIPQHALDIAVNYQNYEMINYFLNVGLGITKQTLRIAKKSPDLLKLLLHRKSNV